jgi:hypothetical protein
LGAGLNSSNYAQHKTEKLKRCGCDSAKAPEDWTHSKNWRFVGPPLNSAKRFGLRQLSGAFEASRRNCEIRHIGHLEDFYRAPGG